MRFAKVTKEVETKNLGKREITFLVPQVDNTEELTQFFGGAAEVVSRMNKVIARSAYQSSMLRLKDFAGESEDEFTEAANREVELTKAYKPEASGGLSKNAKAENVDKITALAEQDKEKFLSMTPEQILAMLTGQSA